MDPKLVPVPQPIQPSTNPLSDESVVTSNEAVPKDKVTVFREFIETEVLRIMTDLIEQQLLTEEKMREIARLVLDTIKPTMTLDELYVSAVKLDDKYSELAPLVYKIMYEYEEKYAKKAIEQVRKFVHAGKYDDAQDLVKKILEFKINT